LTRLGGPRASGKITDCRPGAKSAWNAITQLPALFTMTTEPESPPLSHTDSVLRFALSARHALVRVSAFSAPCGTRHATHKINDSRSIE
jgi:hypothetical protein